MSTIVQGAAAVAAAQAATNIPGATGLPAGTLFSGNVTISQAIGQSLGALAAATCRAVVSWVPGVGGTPASTVAEVDLVLGAGGAATESQAAESVNVPVTLYVGTSGTGAFQLSVINTGTVSNQLAAATVNGVCQ